MKRTLWKLFPFTAIDSKAAEAWLNRLGEQGWRLGSAGLYTARFWQTGEPVSYAVTPEQGRREDFLVLCRDAGWELAARSRKMELYASRAGARPIPLETDQALECRSFLRRVGKGSVELLMSAAAQPEELSQEELDALYDILKGLEESRHD